MLAASRARFPFPFLLLAQRFWLRFPVLYLVVVMSMAPFASGFDWECIQLWGSYILPWWCWVMFLVHTHFKFLFLSWVFTCIEIICFRSLILLLKHCTVFFIWLIECIISNISVFLSLLSVVSLLYILFSNFHWTLSLYFWVRLQWLSCIGFQTFINLPFFMVQYYALLCYLRGVRLPWSGSDGLCFLSSSPAV